MKKKRIMSLVVLLIFASCVILPCFSVHVYAAEKKTTGYWKFVKSWDEQTSSLTHSGSNFNETISGSASGGFHDRSEIAADGYRFSYTSLEDRLHEGSCNGEYGEAVFTFSPLPGATLQSGEKLGITASVSCSTSGHHVGVSGQLMIDYTRSLESNSYTYFKTEVDTGNYVIVPEQIEQKEGKRSGSHWDRIGNTSGTYYTIIPSGKKSGDSLYIRFHFNAYETRIDSIYQYEWVDTTPVAAHAEDTGDKDDAEDIGNTDDTGKDDVTVESSVPEEETPVTGETVTTDEAGNIFQTITQFADEETGEDKGAGIITAIIIGVAGALAAAGALSSSSGGNKDGGDDIKRQKTYKMKVYKGFGDSIRKGAKPVTVWARIVEVIRGEDINRPELSEKIIVSGSDMNVKDAGMENTYKGAEVSIPADSEVQTATLTFTYNGEGGVFRNNIIFKVIGEPEITFPDVTEDGKRWDVNYSISRVDMIAGVGGQERLRFVITNATEEPKDIRFLDHDGYDITWEKDSQWQFTYYACIENRTPPIEKENGIFAFAKVTKVQVEAEFEDGLTISNQFSIWLYPEGLAAQGKLTNGRLTVNTVPRGNSTDGKAEIDPTVFSLTLAYLDGNGKVVTVDQPSFNYGKFTDDGKYGDLFLINFDYDIKHRSSSGIAFYPENTLPSLGDPYEAHMPIAVENEEGRRYIADLPMAIIGEVPKPVYSDADRQKELNLLKKDILFFGLERNPDVDIMVRLATSGAASVDEIQDARRAIIQSATIFYRDCRDANRDMDRLLTQYIVIAGTMVKAGDYALEYVLKAKLGSYGGIAAKVINPMKNLFATYIGEIYANGNLDNAPEFNKTLLKSCEDALYAAISSMIPGGDSLQDKPDTYIPYKLFGKEMALTGNAYEEIKNVLGYVIAVYLMIRFIDHYYNGKPDKKGDVFRSMVAACSDLSFKLLGDFVLGMLKKGASWVIENTGKLIGDWLRNFCQGQINEAAHKVFDYQLGLGVKAYGGVTNEALKNARTAKEFAKKAFLKENNYYIKAISNAGKDAWDSKTIGTVLNYLFGKKENVDDGYDFKSTEDFAFDKGKEWLAEYVKTRFGVKADEIVYTGIENWIQEKVNPMEVTLQFRDNKLIVGMLGYNVKILLTGENFNAIAEMLFETMFSWLDACWDMMTNEINVPDPRKRLEKDVDRVRQELEEQRERMENLKDVEFVYTGK